MSGILGKIFSTGAATLVSGIGDALDKNITNAEEKMAAKATLIKLSTDLISKITVEASSIIQTEAKGNWLQRSWRPITMLLFVFIVVYSKFVALVFSLPVPELEPQFWELIKLGLGGYVFGRSIEKTASTIVSNVDIIPQRFKSKKQ